MRIPRCFLRRLLPLSLAVLATSCAVERQQHVEERRTVAFDLYAEGEALEKTQDYEAALQKYRAALEMELTERPAFLYKVGRMHHLLGNPERAMIFYDRAIELAPDFEMAEAHRELARLELVEAGVLREKAEVVESEPEDLAPLSALGTPMRDRKAREEASAPDAPADTPPGQATAVAPAEEPVLPKPAEVASAFESLKPEAARAAIFPELTEGPLASVDAEKARARDAESQKRWSDAALSWSRILRSHPGDVEAHLGYARALVKTGRIGTGMEEFAEAARLAPENADVYLRWANAAVEAGEWDEAARLYAQARSLDPSNLKVLNNLAALELTRGAYGESVSLLRQVVEAEPRFAPAHLNLALALEGEGAPAGEVIEPLETYLRLGGARSAEAEQWLVRLRGMQAAP
ncbi:MAG: hypothetical protein PWP23_418 [Candidatus Sumerlaeota bacterium]|nr:hypothetical protein [Candidatus Sumerlaeota bacterium]